MKSVVITILTFVFCSFSTKANQDNMGLFEIFRKKEQPKENQESNVLLAMPMFINGDRYELNTAVDKLKNYWGLNVSDITGDSESAVLTIDEQKVAIVFIPAPIPMGDIEGVAQFAYNWPTLLDDLKNFTGHCIVSILPGPQPTVERFELLTKVLHSILTASNSIGVYQGGQTLIIPKGQYVELAEGLKNDQAPIHLWVYIGLRKSEKGNSLYTYGLGAFGKYDLEIIDSKLGFEELFDFISNICAYVISSDVTLKDGETLGYTADQKIKITLSKGKFVEGKTLKLDM